MSNDDHLTFDQIYQELFMPNSKTHTEHFDYLTPEEASELDQINSEGNALDVTLGLAMAHHNNRGKALLLRKQEFWKKLRVRLGEKWPSDQEIIAKDGKLYRTPKD